LEHIINTLTRRVNLKPQVDTKIGNENADSIEGNLINKLIDVNLNYLAKMVLHDQKSILFRIYC